MGVFFGGKFYLTVSLPWDSTTDPDRVTFVQTLFEKVSQYLYIATNQSHSIGAIFYSPNLLAGSADIEISTDDALSDSTDARLWMSSTSLQTYEKALTDVTVIVHELGHYLYDLRDEYLAGSTWSCVDDVSTGTCLMELYYDVDHVRWANAVVPAQYYPDLDSYLLDAGSNPPQTTFLQNGPSFLCWGSTQSASGNHDPTTGTPQNTAHGLRSCWDVAADDTCHGFISYGLVKPAAGPSTALVAVPSGPPSYVPLIPVERIALLLDRSGSMLGAKWEGAKVGAETLIDLMSPGQEFALSFFATTASGHAAADEVPQQGADLETWRTNQKGALAGLIPGGSTAIGAGLALSWNAIAGMDLAARQSILLLSDGRENIFTPSAEATIPDLVSRNVRVFPVGFGSDQDDVLMKFLAEKTGGEYVPMPQSLSPSDIQAAIPEVMAYLSAAITEKSLVTALYDADELFAGDVDVVPFRWGQFPAPGGTVSGPPPKEILFPVQFSAGSQSCTIGCSWDSGRKHFDVDVLRPGETDPPTRGFQVVRGSRPYVFYTFKRPPGGQWKLRIRGTDIRGTRFKVYGSQVHPKLRMETHVGRGIVAPGASVTIQAFLRSGKPIGDASVEAWIFQPDGTWVQVTLAASRETNGTYSATVPTLPGIDGAYLVCVDATKQASPRQAKELSFQLRKLTSFVATSSGRFDRLPLHGTNPKPPTIPPEQKIRFERWLATHPRR